MTADEALAVRAGDPVEIWQDGSARGVEVFPGGPRNGDVFRAADPPRLQDCAAPHLVLVRPGGPWAVSIGYLALPQATSTPARCTCPTHALMASGCRCGAIRRDREAVVR